MCFKTRQASAPDYTVSMENGGAYRNVMSCRQKPVGPNGRLSPSFNFLKILTYKDLMRLKLNLRPFGTDDLS